MTHPPFTLNRHAMLAAALVLAAGLGGCTIPLPDGQQRLPAPAADGSVPPPPGMAPGQAAQTLPDRGEPIARAQTFRGVIPCASCEGQRLTLTLLPDWTWRMRRVYFGTREGKDMSFVSVGRWQRQVDAPNRIQLIGDRNEGGMFEFVSSSTLRMLDQNGEPIQSALNYSLTQQFDTDLIGDVFTMRGQVVSQNGASTMALCGTGKRYPVAAGGQAQALAGAYAKLRVAPGTPVLMWVDGRIAGQPPNEEIVVEQLARGTLDSPCD